MNNEIYVVDDEEDIRSLITDILVDAGYLVSTASSSTEIFNKINEKIPSVIILDIWLQGSEIDGLGILEILVKQYPYIPIIMISGHGTIDTVINALKIGAYDYIEKPFSEDKILITVKRAIETSTLIVENNELKFKFYDPKNLIGESAAITKIKSIIDKVSPTTARILISGNSGSGKTLVAKFIHLYSKRKNSKFIVFNASGKSSEDIESELFGESYALGMSVKPRKIGIFEMANKGTLLLQDVENLPMSIQNKILYFLQNNQTIKTSTHYISSFDIRIIASTSKDLANEIKKGTFREDLFYRLNVVPISIPSLSNRMQDIPLLINYFLDVLYKREHYSPIILAPSTIAALQSYNWPGNIRQLRNILEWLLIMYSHEKDLEITPSMLPSEILTGGNKISHPYNNQNLVSMSLRDAREVFESQYLGAQLDRFNGNISKMSKAIGMERSALHRKLKSLDIAMQNEKQ